jgi:hypothetical protein
MNNLAGQLQLMLRQIQKAGDNSSSTDSVRWYTIPTDTEMPKADVTFNTIGFIGDAGAGATFKLYYNSNGTGSKTYHVYFKQLAGTGKLTLTTGVGAVDLVVSVGTYVMIIYVDENGNISTQGSTPVNTVTAGNTQPVTSGAVSTAVQEIKDYTKDYVDAKMPDYSITEQPTGRKWIDGKPTYTIVFSGTSLPSSGTVLQTNVDTLIQQYGSYSNSTTQISLPYNSGNTKCELRGNKNNNNLYIQHSSVGSIIKFNFIAEYTKTTD